MNRQIKMGLAFHLRHNELTSFCTDYGERLQYIKEHKPKGEQALRLRLFQLIPYNKLPQPLKKAQKPYNNARELCNKEQEVHHSSPYIGLKQVIAYSKAWQVCTPKLLKLHKELCPNCPFDESTIFTRKNEKGEWC